MRVRRWRISSPPCRQHECDGGGGLEGLDDVTAYPKITAALLKAGYSKDDIAKIWGGNALRVMREAQALAETPTAAAAAS